VGATLLSLVQSACAEAGLPVPAAVAAATDTQSQQLFALINAVGADLLSKATWTALQTQAIINVEVPTQTTADIVDGDAYVYNMPTFPVGPVTSYIITGNGIQTSTRVLATAAGPGGITAQVDMQCTADGTGVDVTISRDTYEVPADFVTFINRTQWDRGFHWEMLGPMSPQEDQWMRSGIVATGPRRRYRQVGRGQDVFRLWPPPSAGDTPGTLAYEYLSAYWAFDSAGDPAPAFTADVDTCIFDDRLMIEGLKWRFLAQKGMDYTASFAIWQQQVQTAIARDGGAPTLSLAKRRWPIFISPANVADGNWPSSP